jgi:predicted Rossmann fold nucleotide-binding protein DprA/Smf involved in DNA uptake
LQRYHTLFEAYWPRVSALLDEVSTAIKAQQIAQAKAKLPAKLSTASQQPARSEKHPEKRDPILNLLEGSDISFAQVVDALNLTAEELQKRLIDLEMQGQITILITEGNRKR